MFVFFIFRERVDSQVTIHTVVPSSEERKKPFYHHHDNFRIPLRPIPHFDKGNAYYMNTNYLQTHNYCNTLRVLNNRKLQHVIK